MSIRLGPEQENTGFDKALGEYFQTIPVLETRTILVDGKHEAVQPVSTDDSIVKIVSYVPFGSKYKLTLRGVGPGIADVVWDTSTARRDRSKCLEIAVRPVRYIPTGFSYVTLSGGRQTSRTIGSVDKMILDANRILQPQANVKIIKMSEQICDLSAGGAALSLDGKNNILALARHIGGWRIQNQIARKEFEVFFVPELEAKAGNSDTTQAATYESVKTCFYEDDVSPLDEGAVLAHEMCHAYGRSGHTNKSGQLMYKSSTKTFVPKTLADLLNPI